MTQIDVCAEWRKLCEEHEIVRVAYFQSFALINQKFSAINQITSHANPIDNELSQFERTWQEWEDVKKRMDAFVKKYA
ncbi:MAG: hypothetical protein ACLGHI_05130 [Gammaproteobacteria bacterium]